MWELANTDLKKDSGSGFSLPLFGQDGVGVGAGAGARGWLQGEGDMRDAGKS